MLVVIDGPMINRFIDDKEKFRISVNDLFQQLDGDCDGMLLRDDLRCDFSPLMAADYQPSPADAKVDNSVFDKFDKDGDGSIDRQEFWSMMMEILTAVARGIGPMPVLVGVEQDSLLMKAYECELGRAERKLAKIAEGTCEDGECAMESIGMDLKKKRSRKIFAMGMCACSPRYLGED